MYKITATVYTDSTEIEKEGTEIIRCEERVDDLGEIQEIIMYHWRLRADEYELTLTHAMTAREFLEHCGHEVNVRNLSRLTDYIGDLSNIDFAQFPDAAIPDEILKDAEMEANFQDWMDGRR